VFWGIGHTATLLLVAGGCLILRLTIPDGLSGALEFLVGVMLVGLGAHVLRRLWREREVHDAQDDDTSDELRLSVAL
jgi:ascorbate-specific PTS system EIIC-type component UlaA